MSSQESTSLSVLSAIISQAWRMPACCAQMAIIYMIILYSLPELPSGHFTEKRLLGNKNIDWKTVQINAVTGRFHFIYSNVSLFWAVGSNKLQNISKKSFPLSNYLSLKINFCQQKKIVQLSVCHPQLQQDREIKLHQLHDKQPGMWNIPVENGQVRKLHWLQFYPLKCSHGIWV